MIVRRPGAPAGPLGRLIIAVVGARLIALSATLPRRRPGRSGGAGSGELGPLREWRQAAAAVAGARAHTVEGSARADCTLRVAAAAPLARAPCTARPRARPAPLLRVSVIVVVIIIVVVVVVFVVAVAVLVVPF